MVKKEEIVLRFGLKPVGPPRSEQQLRTDIEEAVREAVKEFNKRESVEVKVQAEPEGGFLGFGIEWIWLLKAFVGGVAAAGGKKAGEALFTYVAEALRKRNIIPGQESTASTATADIPSGQRNKRIRKSSTKKKTDSK